MCARERLAVQTGSSRNSIRPAANQSRMINTRPQWHGPLFQPRHVWPNPPLINLHAFEEVGGQLMARVIQPQVKPAEELDTMSCLSGDLDKDNKERQGRSVINMKQEPLVHGSYF